MKHVAMSSLLNRRMLTVLVTPGLLALLWIPLVTAAPAADEASEGLVAVLEVIGTVDDAGFQYDLLKGASEALVGRKSLTAPPVWKELGPRLLASPDARVQALALELAVLFGDARAVDSLTKSALDASLSADKRRAALAAMVERRVSSIAPHLLTLLDDEALRADALRSLAAYDVADTSQAILKRYAKLSPAERNDAVNTLASRPAWALDLLHAVGKGTVPRSDVPAFTARQLGNFKNAEIDRTLVEVWGTVRATSQQKADLLPHYRALLTLDQLQSADASLGRVVYNRICGQCHKLFGEGGTVGPDLTGSNRKNLDYLLENLLDPSALIARDYKLTSILTADGRLLSGIVRRQDDNVVVLQTVNEVVSLERGEIEALEPSAISMMPEGILDRFTQEEIQGLIAYLVSSEQVPLPAKEPVTGGD